MGNIGGHEQMDVRIPLYMCISVCFHCDLTDLIRDFLSLFDLSIVYFVLLSFVALTKKPAIGSCACEHGAASSRL